MGNGTVRDSIFSSVYELLHANNAAIISASPIGLALQLIFICFRSTLFSFSFVRSCTHHKPWKVAFVTDWEIVEQTINLLVRKNQQSARKWANDTSKRIAVLFSFAIKCRITTWPNKTDGGEIFRLVLCVDGRPFTNLLGKQEVNDESPYPSLAKGKWVLERQNTDDWKTKTYPTKLYLLNFFSWLEGDCRTIPSFYPPFLADEQIN